MEKLQSYVLETLANADDNRIALQKAFDEFIIKHPSAPHYIVGKDAIKIPLTRSDRGIMSQNNCLSYN